MPWGYCVMDNSMTIANCYFRVISVQTIFPGVTLNSNEPLRAAHIQKLANQSICNSYQHFLIKVRKLWSFGKDMRGVNPLNASVAAI